MGGSLQYTEIENIFKKYPEYKSIIKNFVETGTYKGHTTRMAAKHFENVFTVELNYDLFIESGTKSQEEGLINARHFYGDSTDFLNKIVPTLPDSSIYFIDAHLSGIDSSSIKGNEVPLLSEIDAILTHDKKQNIFIIDDARFWINEKFRPQDWKHISLESILNLFQKHNVTIKYHYLTFDRYLIFT